MIFYSATGEITYECIAAGRRHIRPLIFYRKNKSHNYYGREANKP